MMAAGSRDERAGENPLLFPTVLAHAVRSSCWIIASARAWAEQAWCAALAPQTPGAIHPESLTEREGEMAELVITGKTNRAIRIENNIHTSKRYLAIRVIVGF
jgi:DNA-binding NarL/FixJ family response regulator